MDDPAIIIGGYQVPAGALEFSYIRAAGPGGQNVNKVATAAQLRFDAAGFAAIDEAMLERLRNVAGRRMTAAGVIVITARRFRTREQNRRDALSRLATLIERAALPQKRRRPTRPSRAVRERRLEGKRRRGEVKKTRGQVGQED